jgi:superfamily I DNA/RNA helicase
VEPVLLNGALGLLEKYPDYGTISYDKNLGDLKILEILAHELGHLELHSHRLNDATGGIDPITTSIYADEDQVGLARYSPRMREEVEADAFALELLCPSAEAFAVWRHTPDLVIADVASAFNVDVESARVQLASGVYLGVQGDVDGLEARKLATPDASQISAINHLGGHAIVEAGPGTGKTSTLVHRVKFLVETQGVHPANILVLTFSNEAAEELRLRLVGTLGAERAGQMAIHTFHGFGFGLLHVYYTACGLRENMRLLDEDAQQDFVFALLGDSAFRPLINLKDMDKSAEDLCRLLNHCSGRMVDPATLEQGVAAWSPVDGEDKARARAIAFAALYRLYKLEKEQANVVDFCDLIAMPLDLLRGEEEVRSTVQAQYQHVLIDEFQDVTHATSLLLAQVAGANPVWAVGDARQAIYRFLGASPENVSRFEETFPDPVKYSLGVNYRSARSVVDGANLLADILEDVDPAQAVSRWTCVDDPNATEGTLGVRHAIAATDRAEADGVVAEVVATLARGVPPSDVAVLARRNEDVRRIALALSGRGIEVAANNLMEPDGIGGDLVGLLSLADDRGVASRVRLTIAVSRYGIAVEQRNKAIQALVAGEGLNGVGLPENVVAQYERIAAIVSGAPGADGFAYLTEVLFGSGSLLRPHLSGLAGAEERLCLSEIATVLSLAVAYRAAGRSESPREARLGLAKHARRRLQRGQPGIVAPPRQENAVRVMTCHASKGLEFPHVFVVGQSLAKHPSQWSYLPAVLRPGVAEDVEQADALLFVAVTRAKKEVLVSSARRSRIGTSSQGDRKLVPLLDKWRIAGTPDVVEWHGANPDDAKRPLPMPWGKGPGQALSMRVLDRARCGIQRYGEEILGLRFPDNTEPIYPRFIVCLKGAVAALYRDAAISGNHPDQVGAAAYFSELWDREEPASHPHSTMYRDIGQEVMLGVLEGLPPQPFSFYPDESLQLCEGRMSMRPGLIGTVVASDGAKVDVGVTAKSLELKADGSLLWSKIDEPLKGTLALSRKIRATPNMTVIGVRSASLLAVNSPAQRYVDGASGNMIEQATIFDGGEMPAPLDDKLCDRCRVRLLCPLWLELVEVPTS